MSWRQEHESLTRADRASQLDAAQLARLATVAFLIGRDDESVDAWTRAQQAFLEAGAVPHAVRCIFWLASMLAQKGERARASGWIARARRLLDACGEDCVEHGYLLLPAGMQAIAGGEPASAYEYFSQAGVVGRRFDDADLIALSLHSRGRVLIRLNRVEEGVALLDEAMTAIDAGDATPLVVGDVYCSVIEGCLEIFDIRRASEWTAVLSSWCDAQPDLVPYRGQCLVRRAEIMRLHGEWNDALDEAARACEWLAQPPGVPAAGEAFYQHAELHRLRGRFAAAEEAYREAHRWGRSPQPGLALLRLARGDVQAAAAAIRQACEEAGGRHIRLRLLPAQVEIMLAAGDLAAARAAADELDALAGDCAAPLLEALAAAANGAVRLAAGDAHAALEPLARARQLWQQVDAPYEAACVRVQLGRAHAALGDADTASLELDAARAVFERLGAAPDLARIASAAATKPAAAAGLTPRELTVLRLVASGMTNRAIAAELFISEKTVARHISNMFRKLGVSSRAAAAAFAHRNGLA